MNGGREGRGAKRGAFVIHHCTLHLGGLTSVAWRGWHGMSCTLSVTPGAVRSRLCGADNTRSGCIRAPARPVGRRAGRVGTPVCVARGGGGGPLDKVDDDEIEAVTKKWGLEVGLWKVRTPSRSLGYLHATSLQGAGPRGVL